MPDELLLRTFGSIDLITFSPVVTIEPRRRKFHCPIRLKIPLPPSFRSDSNLRLLCSINGGSNRAVWEDVTDSTPLSIVDQCLVFTTTVSARFWLAHCQRSEHCAEIARCADDIWRHLIRVPFMVKFVIFGKRSDTNESNLRVFCMTDDKEDERSLEQQEHYVQVARSRDVEVHEGQRLWLEFGGNLSPYRMGGSMRHLNNARYWAPQPITEQLSLIFRPFEENRLAFVVRLRDVGRDASGRIVFMKESIKWLASIGQQRTNIHNDPRKPVCTLRLKLPRICVSYDDILGTPRQNSYLANSRIGNLTMTEIVAALDNENQWNKNTGNIDNKEQDRDSLQGYDTKPDWARLAPKLGIPRDEMDLIAEQWPRAAGSHSQSPTLGLLLHWHRLSANLDLEDREQELARALVAIGRSDVANELGVEILPKPQLSKSSKELLRDIEMIPAKSVENLYVNSALLDRQTTRAGNAEPAEAEIEADRKQRRNSSRLGSRSSSRGKLDPSSGELQLSRYRSNSSAGHPPISASIWSL